MMAAEHDPPFCRILQSFGSTHFSRSTWLQQSSNSKHQWYNTVTSLLMRTFSHCASDKAPVTEGSTTKFIIHIIYDQINHAIQWQFSSHLILTKQCRASWNGVKQRFIWRVVMVFGCFTESFMWSSKWYCELVIPGWLWWSTVWLPKEQARWEGLFRLCDREPLGTAGQLVYWPELVGIHSKRTEHCRKRSESEKYDTNHDWIINNHKFFSQHLIDIGLELVLTNYTEHDTNKWCNDIPQ